MRLWVLFKFHRECWCFCFCFSTKLFWLVSVAVYNPSSIGYGSSISSVPKSLLRYRSVPDMYHPVVTLGPKQWFISLVLKIFGMLTRIGSTLFSSRMSSGVHKHLYWVISPSPSYSAISQVLLSSLGLCFLVLWPELGVLVTLLCWALSHTSSLGPYTGPSWGRTERGITINRVRPVLLEL